MKRITFDKAVRLDLGEGGWRKDYPGYLLRHTEHPGRDFVIARGSKTFHDGTWRMIEKWYVYDRATGLSITSEMGTRRTRSEMEEHAIARLYNISPEGLARSIETKVMKRMTQILQEAP